MKKIMLRHYPGLQGYIDNENVFTRQWPGGAAAITNTTEIVRAAMEEAGRIYLEHYGKKKDKIASASTA
jgi:hypothetical protein